MSSHATISAARMARKYARLIAVVGLMVLGPRLARFRLKEFPLRDCSATALWLLLAAVFRVCDLQNDRPMLFMMFVVFVGCALNIVIS